MTRVKVMRCDCGFEASGTDDGDVLTRAREHAWGVHQTDLPPELMAALAASPDGAPRDAAVQ
jgi:hypothetical protein